jgi:hypothetical protein
LIWAVVALCLAVALAAVLWFVAATVRVRVPYWGEAEVLFEASRLHFHLPLFTDPLVGAHEYGEPPSRYYVTYPPLWAWVVSLVPIGAQRPFARVACIVAWYGALGALARGARPESRAEALAAAVYVGGIWVLANFATVGRPDAIAVALAAFALDRAVRMERLDVLGIVLFVLVPWIKPTVFGLPACAILGGALGDRTRAGRTAGTALVVVGASAALAHLASRGLVFEHVLRSNAQPLSLDAWLANVPGRLPFFGPLLGWAAWLGYKDRARPGIRLGLWALGGAAAWTLFALAKTGSSSNYWMEPCIAALVLVARAAPGPIRFGGGSFTTAALVLAVVVWTGVASVKAAVEHARAERAGAEVVAGVRARCGAAEGVVAADEAGVELSANGRILAPLYQMSHLVRSGAFPLAPLRDDLYRSTCFVEHSGQLRLVPELEDALQRGFTPAYEAHGYRVWRRRR